MADGRTPAGGDAAANAHLEVVLGRRRSDLAGKAFGSAVAPPARPDGVYNRSRNCNSRSV